MANNLKHYEYLGQCFDINEVDPLNIPNSHKGCRVFKFDQRNMETSSEGIQYPAHTYYTPIDYVVDSSDSWEIFSEYDFQEKFQEVVGFELNIANIFKFGSSATYDYFIKKTGSWKNILNFTHIYRPVFTLNLNYNYPGQKIQLDAGFKGRVENLKTDPNSTKDYENLLRDFGTHFAKFLTFGGRAYKILVISISNYTKLVQRNVDVAAQAERSFEVDLKLSSDTNDASSKYFEQITKAKRERIVFLGGEYNLDWKKWSDSVVDNAMPIDMELRLLSDLFTHYFFPNDRNIELKKRIMEQVLTEYVPTMPENQICFGDTINLRWNADNDYIFGSNGPLSCSLYLESPNLKVADCIIQNPLNLSSREPVKYGDQIVLYNKVLKTYLDYDGSGQGFSQANPMWPAFVNYNPTAYDTRWKIVFGFDSTNRPYRTGKNVLKGDLILLSPKKAGSTWLAGNDRHVFRNIMPTITEKYQWQIEKK